MPNRGTRRTLADGLTDYLTDLQSAGIDRIARPTPEQTERPLPAAALPPSELASLPRDAHEPMQSKIDNLLANFNPKSGKNVRADLLFDLSKIVAACTLCPELVINRSKTVFGSGNPAAELVFIGEGPGADEDRQGMPFVGRSGQLLTDIIVKGMKLPREEVYICNIVRCRPPKNRNPLPEEAACCRPFLDATLRVVQPKFICCLGAVAAANLLKTNEPIGKLRGRVLDYRGAQVVCTFHPAYLLRNPPAKAQAWEDVKLLLKIMGKR